MLFLIIFFSLNLSAKKFSTSDVSVYKDGEFDKKIKCYSSKNNFYFNVKDVASILYGNLSWYPVAKKVKLSIHTKQIEIFYNKSYVNVSTLKVNLPISTNLYNSKLLVPVEFFTTPEISNTTLYDIYWGSSTKTLNLYYRSTLFPPRYFIMHDSLKIIVESTEYLQYIIEKTNKTLHIKFKDAKISKDEDYEINNDFVKKISFYKKKGDVNLKISFGENADLSLLKTELKNNGRVLQIQIPKIEEFTIVNSTETRNNNLQVKNFKRIKKIVLDAGHGGTDPGAIGQNNLMEKDINLQIALQLADLLQDEGYEVILTRSDDTFLTLAERAKIANDVKADLFISIHSNSSPNPQREGVETYFLSETATDAEAQRVANMENAVFEKELKTNPTLSTLLLSLAQVEFINESAKLAGYIQTEIAKRISPEYNEVKQAGFFILRSAGMPSILFEAGFLSNINDESRLNSKKYQNKIVDSIFGGIIKYEDYLIAKSE